MTGLSGKPYEFYKQIDIIDLHKYLKEKYHEHTGNCYLSYFEKYAEELFKFKPHKRSWILQAIKRFGDYYFRKYNNREVTLDLKDHIYLVSLQFIEEKVKKIILLPGEIGLITRLGLLSGLREQELIYIKEREVCINGYGCDCEKLHFVNCKKNGMTIIAIGWTRGKNPLQCHEI